jgi:chaperone required for assembly of F1-ATPase
VTQAGSDPPRQPGKEFRRPLPKRFYQGVSVAPNYPPPPRGEGLGVGGTPTLDVLASPPPHPSPTRGEGSATQFRVLLDGKPMRTPAKSVFAVPSRALAEAIAAEWDAQGERIDPASMPLTRIVNSAIDGVRGRESEVRADIAKYAGSDLVCYRAGAPEELARQQAEAWDDIVTWAGDALGARLLIGTGIMPVAQPAQALARIAEALEDFDAFALAALHVTTTLTGSAVLALALARGQITAENAWAAAHVDEDFQIAKWGEDAEAMARRARRWVEMEAASRMLALLPP